MRIATWNVNSLSARLPRLLGWLAAADPDVVVLQETKLPQDGFPGDALAGAGYEFLHRGQGRWNGVALISRIGIADVEVDLPGAPGFPDPDSAPEARYISATCGGVRVAGVYVPNGRTVDDPHYDYKLQWLQALAAHLAMPAAAALPFAVMGDFNVAPTDADVWDPSAFVGSTHVTAPERDALAALTAQGLTDIRPTISKGAPFSYWDYRGGAFHKGMGMRIDLVYGNAAFHAAVTQAFVDRDARKPGLKGTPAPSDHAPVIIDLDISV